MWQWLIAILGASMGVWNFLTLVVGVFILLAAFGGSVEAWGIIVLCIGVFILGLIALYARGTYKKYIHERYKKVWDELPEKEKEIWNGISIEVEHSDFGGIWERGEQAFENRFRKQFSFMDFFRDDFKKRVPFPKENWNNTIYVSVDAAEKIKKLGLDYEESNGCLKWLIAIIVLIIAIVIGVVYMQRSESKAREMTPEERHRSDSIRAAYWREQDSIKEVRKREHEEYVRKMARDIVNSGRNDSRRSNNMRGWDPASEDDSDENGMDRYMENDDERGWD